MRTWKCTLLLAAITLAWLGTNNGAYGQSQALTPARAAAVEESARAFMRAVAHDVTQDGPAAWRKHFSESPSFFMASEGRLVFPNRAAATKGIQDFARTIKHIELRWGDDLRVDPLTSDLAIVAATWHEVQVSVEGKRVETTGFFTGCVEYQNGRWQFRDAHWSVAAPLPAVP